MGVEVGGWITERVGRQAWPTNCALHAVQPSSERSFTQHTSSPAPVPQSPAPRDSLDANLSAARATRSSSDTNPPPKLLETTKGEGLQHRHLVP